MMQAVRASNMSFGRLILETGSIDRCMTNEQKVALYEARDVFEKEIKELDEKGVDIKVYGTPGTGKAEYIIKGYKKNGGGENMMSQGSSWTPLEMMEAAIKTAKHLINVYRKED